MVTRRSPLLVGACGGLASRGSTLALPFLCAVMTGCTTDPVGQIVIAVQTDVHLPKDIDTIRIEVLNEGVPKFKNDYERLGTPEGAILLPGTLTLVASDDPTDAVQVIVSAFSGGDVSILREAVTTIPPERTVTLQLPLQFLCDGQADIDDSGNAVSTCPEGKTCIAGQCQDNAVDSNTLPDYRPEDIYVTGVCLDVGVCFNLGEELEPDADCSVEVPPDSNIALQTEGDGICGAIGCFVALDAESPLGWTTRPDGRVQLPAAACDQIPEKIIRVVGADTSDLCPLKRTSVPTCGPWSAAGPGLPYDGPIVLSSGQARPSSLTLGGGRVVWTSGGTLMGDGTVKAVEPEGGTPLVIATDQAPPRDVVVDGNTILWTVADDTSMTGGAIVSASIGGPVELVASGLALPEGIATRGGSVFWTDFRPDMVGGIYRAVIQAGSTPVLLSPAVNYPFRVAADDRDVYWTDEGTFGMNDGAVQRLRYSEGGAVAEALQTGLATPRGLALDIDDSGFAVAVFWTNFAEDGALMRATIDAGGAVGAIDELATGQVLPSGVTVDGNYVYWTNRGDGSVMRLDKGAAPGASPVTLATDQRSPGEIAVDDDYIYWVNEGTVAASLLDGSVVRLDKPL
jgi:hypothetical protein